MATSITIRVGRQSIPINVSALIDQYEELRVFRNILAELEEGDVNTRQRRAEERLGELLNYAISDFDNNFLNIPQNILRDIGNLQENIRFIFRDIQISDWSQNFSSSAYGKSLLRDLRDIDTQISRLDTATNTLRRQRPTSDGYPSLERSSEQLVDSINNGLSRILGPYELRQIYAQIITSRADEAITGLEFLRNLPDSAPKGQLGIHLGRIQINDEGSVKRMLRGINVLLRDNPEHSNNYTDEIRGLTHFLEHGEPEALARILSLQLPSNEITQGNATLGLRRLNDFSPQAIQGISFFMTAFRDNTRITASRLFRVLTDTNASIPRLNGIFETLELLRNSQRCHNIAGLVAQIHDRPIGARGIEGHLFSVVQLLDRYPDATLTFEVPASRFERFPPYYESKLSTFRRTDILVERPGSLLPLRVEVKERKNVYASRDLFRQLARDIFLDYESRRLFHGSSNPMESIRWMIRAQEMVETQVRRLSRQRFGDPNYDINSLPYMEYRQLIEDAGLAVRQQLSERFLRVFDHEDEEVREALSFLPDAELQRYREAFQELEFVELF